MCHSDESRAPAPPRHAPAGPHGEEILTASGGARFRTYLAEPGGPASAAVVLLPDVRGLHPFYEDLAVRFAETGALAVAVDYYGRSAGVDRREESFDWKAHLAQVNPEGVASDVAAAVRRIGAKSEGRPLPVFTVGFCFGGANSWRQSGDTPGLAGCIGFYGGRPMERAGPAISRMKAPLLMLLAGADQGTPPTEFEEFARLVRARGVEVESHVYLGAPHSFFDRSFEAHREACADAWVRVLAFMDRHGGRPAAAGRS